MAKQLIKLIRDVSYANRDMDVSSPTAQSILVRAEIDAAALREAGADPKVVKLRASFWRFGAAGAATQLGSTVDLSKSAADESGCTFFAAIEPGAHGVGINSMAGVGVKVELSTDINHATTGQRIVPASSVDPKWCEGTITRGGV